MRKYSDKEKKEIKKRLEKIGWEGNKKPSKNKIKLSDKEKKAIMSNSKVFSKKNKKR